MLSKRRHLQCERCNNTEAGDDRLTSKNKKTEDSVISSEIYCAERNLSGSVLYVCADLTPIGFRSAHTYDAGVPVGNEWQSPIFFYYRKLFIRA